MPTGAASNRGFSRGIFFLSVGENFHWCRPPMRSILTAAKPREKGNLTSDERALYPGCTRGDRAHDTLVNAVADIGRSERTSGQGAKDHRQAESGNDCSTGRSPPKMHLGDGDKENPLVLKDKRLLFLCQSSISLDFAFIEWVRIPNPPRV